MNGKLFSLFAVVAILLVTFAGCGDATTGSTDAEAAEASDPGSADVEIVLKSQDKWGDVYLSSVDAYVDHPLNWSVEQVRGYDWRLIPQGEELGSQDLDIWFTTSSAIRQEYREECPWNYFSALGYAECLVEFLQNEGTASASQHPDRDDVAILEVHLETEVRIYAIMRNFDQEVAMDSHIVYLRMFGTERKIEQYRDTFMKMAATIEME